MQYGATAIAQAVDAEVEHRDDKGREDWQRRCGSLCINRSRESVVHDFILKDVVLCNQRKRMVINVAHICDERRVRPLRLNSENLVQVRNV